MKLTIFTILAMFCFGAFAVDAPVDAPSWLGSVINFFLEVPRVGPVLTKVIAVIGALSGVLTALAVFVEAVIVIPEIAARFSGAKDLEKKIKDFRLKVMPWLKYLSMHNVQKKK